MFELDVAGRDAGLDGGVVGVAVASLDAGVERADPARATREAVSLDGDELVVDGERYALAGADRVVGAGKGADRVVVVGAGKGADRVAAALVAALDGRRFGTRSHGTTRPGSSRNSRRSGATTATATPRGVDGRRRPAAVGHDGDERERPPGRGRRGPVAPTAPGVR